MKKINLKNVAKLLMLAFCVGIVTYDLVCIIMLFATFTWLGLFEFVLAIILGYKLYQNLFNKKEN